MTLISKLLKILLAVALFLPAAGCMKPVLTPQPSQPAEQPSARVLASLQLTEQGYILLERNKPDAAIRVLERAINLNPGNGENYYYLSQAWLMKGEAKQAKEFNSLAETYLKEQTDWAIRVARQKDRIQELEK